MANPEFDKIRESGFTEYFYEPFTETLKRYPKHGGSFELWRQGIETHVFYPQFHGREHVNVEYWLKALQDPESDIRKIFDHRSWAIKDEGKIKIQASLDTKYYQSIENHRDILADGLRLFEGLFKYQSKSFIANNFVYHSSLNSTLKDYGVRYIQGMKYQKHPILDRPKRELLRHFTGERNDLGQYYLIRNCFFEPSQKSADYDNMGACLKDIRNAFFWKKPAIITAHRLNFIGFIRPENREKILVCSKNFCPVF